VSTKRGLIAFILLIVLVIADIFSPLRVEHVVIEFKPETILHLGRLTITNTLIGSWIAMALLVLLARLATRRMVDRPAALSVQNIMETLVESLLNIIHNFVGEHAWDFFPIVGTLFFYILSMNWLSIMPGFGSIGFWRAAPGGRVFVPLLRGGTTDLNTTIALALCSVASVQIQGIRAVGLGEHILHYIAVDKFVLFARRLVREGRVEPGLLIRGMLDLFVGLLELFDELTKVVSFAFRLFGNVFGGEVLLAIMAFLLPFLVSLPFMAIELILGAIQAFVFAALTAAFMGRALAEHPHREHEEIEAEDLPGGAMTQRVSPR
jgi:F-type H+-transporting ATPase subunit a